MTDQEFLEHHIPHRVNLLITYRERYHPASRAKIDAERYRDLFRCSKDVAMLMVRFFLTELGVCLRMKKVNRPDDLTVVKDWKSRCGIRQLTVSEVRGDKRYAAIFEVLKAANRAVAHLEEADVEHAIKVDSDAGMLFDAIDFTEEMIREKVYHSGQKITFDVVMASRENDMQRKKG